MNAPDANKVALWDAINAYVQACGADPSKHVYGNTTRQRAVAEVERFINERTVEARVVGVAEGRAFARRERVTDMLDNARHDR